MFKGKLFLLLGVLLFAVFLFISNSKNEQTITVKISTSLISNDAEIISEPVQHEKAETKQSQSKPVVQTKEIERKAYPSFKLDGKLVDHLEILSQQFENGDALSGYILARNLNHCFVTPLTQQAFDAVIQNVYDRGEDQSGEFIAGYTRAFEFCRGVSSGWRTRHRDILKQAALMGFAPAISQYAEMVGLPDRDEEFQQLAPSKRNAAIIRHRLKLTPLLESAAAGGDLKSMTILYRFYINGEYTQSNQPLDEVKAFAYLTVFLEFVEDPHYFKIFSQAKVNDLARLTPQQLNAADDISTEVIKQIYQNGAVFSLN